MNKPHIHKDIILAWADGAEIEWKNPKNEWELIENPNFYESEKYRIKPERVWPVTSLSPDFLTITYDSCATAGSQHLRLRCVANAAIKQYIIDTESKKPV